MTRTRRPKRLPKPVGVLIVLLLVGALVAGIGLGGRALYNTAFGGSDYSGVGTGRVVVQVQSGDSAGDIGATLFSKGVVKSVKAFRNAAAANEKARDVQPGFYALRSKMSASHAVSLLLDPAARLRGRVTLPEGIPLATVVDRLVKFTDLKRPDILAALKNPAVLGLPAYARGNPEGFLFPATYDVEPGTAAVDAFTMLTDKFGEETAALDLDSRASALGLTPYQALIIASLVEAETPLDEDRPKVARVVLNRLAKGMPLQFDSTLNYIRAERKLHLSLDDLAVDSAYNSYANKGLPPTPINSPGRTSLEATLSPVAGDLLYFVAIDKQGHSFFTSSYQEFLAAKAKAKRDGVL